MEPRLKVVVVVYGNLSDQGGSGLSYFNYQMVKYLHDRNSLEKVYCLDAEKGLPLPSSCVRPIKSFFILKLLFKMLRVVKENFFERFQERLIGEYIFDLYFSRTIDFGDSNVLLNLKPVNPFINEKARQRSIKVVTLATVAHPFFIRSMIRKLEEIYLVKDHSSYSSPERINRLARTYATSDLVVPKSSSSFMVGTFISNGIDPENIGILDNNSSIDFNTYSPAGNHDHSRGDEVIFITVGFMTLKKGLPILLEAWQNLMNENTIRGKLIVVGKLDDSTRQAIQKFAPFANVEFTGHLTDVRLTYHRGDVFIASSVSDLLPKTVLEALSCGLPVIVSNHCGNADLVQPGINGFTYDPFDIDALKEHMRYFFINSSKLKEMKRSARESALTYKANDFFCDMYMMCQRQIAADTVSSI